MKLIIKKFLHHVNDVIVKYADEACYPYSVFGVFAIITYPLFYFLWRFLSPTGYENLYLRIRRILIESLATNGGNMYLKHKKYVEKIVITFLRLLETINFIKKMALFLTMTMSIQDGS
jgi:hypothetical protein